ncbi:hypothetical protein DHEL01_v206212 [Diaporthe helianthi]|uniref:C2H2-type domain-containing protein n=1 Tax=Diaporthe helianthi TaxID=158607 RepID=A0A2P5HYQ6_DIAHE|nr:hypothetical protein DHEL01_v206212 [Diaporthe helianthi]
MAPQVSTAELRRLRARQLLRFRHLSGSPYITKIQDDDLEFARVLVPSFDEDDLIPDDEQRWPPNWSTKRKSLPAFLASWRKLLPIGSTTSEPRAASPTSQTLLLDSGSPSSAVARLLPHRRTVSLSSLPRVSRVSVGSTPPESEYDRNLPDEDHNSETVQDTTSHHPPPESDHNEMAPLTAEDAATLIATAMQQLRNQQNQDFAQIMAAAFAHAPVPQIHVQPANVNGVNGGEGRSSLRPADVGFFCPRKHYGSGVWSDGKITKYFDVFHFIERLRHIERLYSEDDVRRVWSQCLLDDALEWHSHVLTDNDRRLLETATVQAICDKLKARFAKSFSDAMASLKADHLYLSDIAEGKDISSFLQTVISNAKACDMELPAQLVAAFESLAPEIKSQLHKPNENTSLEDFLNEVRSRESVILDLARQRFPSARTVARTRQPIPAYGGRSTIPYNPRYQPAQPQRWLPQQQRFQATAAPFVPQYNRPFTANQPQNQNQSQTPFRPGGQGPIWNAGYSRPWLPPDQYAMWRRQQDQQRQGPQQQQRPDAFRQQVVPENRRLPAPQAPFAADRTQRNQPHPVYHGDFVDFAEQPDTSTYQSPSVEEVSETEPGVETGLKTFDYPLEEAFPNDEQTDYPDVAYFGTSNSTPSVCRYCTKHFHSKNSLMDHVYSVHLKKPRPQNGKTSSSFTVNATLPIPSPTVDPRRNSYSEGASLDAPEGPVGTSTAKN